MALTDEELKAAVLPTGYSLQAVLDSPQGRTVLQFLDKHYGAVQHYYTPGRRRRRRRRQRRRISIRRSPSSGSSRSLRIARASRLMRAARRERGRESSPNSAWLSETGMR